MTKLRVAWMLLLGGVVAFVGLSVALLDGGGSAWAGAIGNLLVVN